MMFYGPNIALRICRLFDASVHILRMYCPSENKHEHIAHTQRFGNRQKVVSFTDSEEEIRCVFDDI